MTVILASQSASRQAMMAAAGVAIEAIPADLDEATVKQQMTSAGEEPRAIAKALALAKAQAVSIMHPGRWVVGSDSLVSVGGQIFDKPVSRDDAADHLRRFSGNVMVLDSSFALVRDGQLIDWASDDARLDVRHLSETFITAYLDAEWPAISGCVGCFRIEGRGVHLFKTITGSHFTILGMPLLPLLDRLRSHGLIAS
jgi:septum formation protein